MNIKFSFILLTTVLIASSPVQADDKVQAVGVLVGPSAHVASNEPMVQKAIEVLKKQPAKVDLRKLPSRPDAPIGASPLRNPRNILILGGPEVVPM